MSQTKKHSILEAFTNTGIAFLISMIIAYFIYPLYFPEIKFSQTFEITLIFTAISLLRGYIIRRFFNKKTINFR